MIITNENYKDILPTLSQFDSNDVIIFTVDNSTFHYRPVNPLFLEYKEPGGNDVIFRILEIDPYDFCAKSYGSRPFGGIFPEVPDSDPRKLVQVTYDLFEECKKRCLPPVKRIELSDLSINLLL
jgi:hypothetical protein